MQLNQNELNHYNRHLLLEEIGEAGQIKLKSAKVLAVGAGGLGCPVLQYISAAGVGKIGIVDFDLVEISNLQRQVLFGYSDVGKNKADTACVHLKNLNPNIKYISYPIKLEKQNAVKLADDYDIIVDGTDNFASRYLLNDLCVLKNKILVHGSIFKFEGQVSVFNYKNGPTYRCLFPEPPETSSMPSCSEIGVLGVLPGIIGAQMANEVLKVILGLGEILSGEVFVYNALNNSNYKIKVQRNEKIWDNYPKTESELLKMDYEDSCKREEQIEIDVIEFKEKLEAGVKVVDVREVYEQPQPSDFETIKMPLSNFTNELSKLNKDEEYVIICQHGVRSLNTLVYLKENEGFTKLTSLRGGIITYC